MSPKEAIERLQFILAHLWMIRNFLKHADEVQEDEEMLDVHRLIYDSIRAVEPAHQRGDSEEYLRRLKGKLPKLKRSAEFFAREYKRASSHTNFEMASISYLGAVRQMEEIFAAINVESGSPADANAAES
jgi:hypothetical protein